MACPLRSFDLICCVVFVVFVMMNTRGWTMMRLSVFEFLRVLRHRALSHALWAHAYVAKLHSQSILPLRCSDQKQSCATITGNVKLDVCSPLSNATTPER